MERGANVGISIKAVKHFNYINKNIVPRKLGRSKLLLIRVNNIYNGGYGIGYDYKIHKLFKRRNIKQKRINMYSRKKNKPQIIRNYKIFAKRYAAVERRLDRAVIKR